MISGPNLKSGSHPNLRSGFQDQISSMDFRDSNGLLSPPCPSHNTKNSGIKHQTSQRNANNHSLTLQPVTHKMPLAFKTYIYMICGVHADAVAHPTTHPICPLKYYGTHSYMYTPGKEKTESRSNNWGGNNTQTLETLGKNQPNKIL